MDIMEVSKDYIEKLIKLVQEIRALDYKETSPINFSAKSSYLLGYVTALERDVVI